MAFSLDKFAGRWGRTLVILSLVYSAACAAVVFTGWGGQAAAGAVGAWGTFPLMIVAGLVLWPVIVDPMQSRRCRLAFGLIFGALVLDFIATAGWSYDALNGEGTIGAWPDVLYLFYYPMSAVACVLLYFDRGGRLDTARSLIDFATLAIGFGTLLWFTALEPLGGMNEQQLIENWSVAGYGIGNAMALVAGVSVGQRLYVPMPEGVIEVDVTEPVFFDPKGERLNG